MAGGGWLYLLGVRAGLAAARILPPRILVPAAAHCGRCFGLLSPARATVASNLRLLRGDPVASRSRRADASSSRPVDSGELFAHYGRTWGEFLSLAADPARRRDWRVRVEGRDHLEAAARSGAVCLLSGHCGNWDLGAAVIGEDLPGLMVVAERLTPPALYSWFVRQRERQGVSVVPAAGGGRRLYRHLRRGGHAALLVDRVFGASARPAPFLGGWRTFPSGGIDLARHAGARLLPVFVWRAADGFVVRIHAPLPAVGDPVVAFARVLEAEVRAHPEQWCLLTPALDQGSMPEGPAVAGAAPA